MAIKTKIKLCSAIAASGRHGGDYFATNEFVYTTPNNLAIVGLTA